jgi:hypothetical protein
MKFHQKLEQRIKKEFPDVASVRCLLGVQKDSRFVDYYDKNSNKHTIHFHVDVDKALKMEKWFYLTGWDHVVEFDPKELAKIEGEDYVTVSVSRLQELVGELEKAKELLATALIMYPGLKVYEGWYNEYVNRVANK